MAIIERTLNIYIFFIEVPNVEVHRQIPRAVEVGRAGGCKSLSRERTRGVRVENAAQPLIVKSLDLKFEI